MTRSRLSSRVLRLVPLLWVCGCGGFTTPPQDVSVGLALTSPGGLPPQAAKDGHTLVLTGLRLTGLASVQNVVLATLSGNEIPLTSAWTLIADGPLSRGDYAQFSLELSALTLEGTWDGRPFTLEAKQAKAREFKLSSTWRVELGQVSTLSLVADPLPWMTRQAGQDFELIDPVEEKASSELMDRFFQSLTAARDDNHDGVEDVMRP